MHTSVLAREELRIFEELISRFDLLSEAEMRPWCDAGMVRERFAGAFGLLGAGRGRTGSWIRSWKMVSEEAYAHQMERINRRSFQRIGPPTASFARN